MRSTRYADLIAYADIGGHRIERLRIREKDAVEIRFSWWKDGRLVPRPLDLSENDLLDLLRKAIGNEVFDDRFLRDLHTLLYDCRAAKPEPPDA